jgi:very-short-patch-repair endonuclease
MCPLPAPIPEDDAVAASAATQRGLVTRAQLSALGLSRDQVRYRVRRGRLHRIYRDVFAVGHLGLDADGLRFAALLACGDGAALSHHAAAAELRVRPRRGGLIDVTIPTRNGRQAPKWVRLHRVARLPDDELIMRGPLRLTSPARTFVDCAATLRDREVARMLDAAWIRHLIDWVAIERAMEAPRAGVGRLRRVINTHTPGEDTTRTRPEERLRRLVLGSSLPRPELNVPAGPWELDLLWREHRQVVEVDSSGYHGSPWARARDARKDAWLGARGYRVLRIPSPLIRGDPQHVLALIAEALSYGSGRKEGT